MRPACRGTFAPGALEMARFGDDTAAVPVDGWTQMIVYRRDLFEESGLEAPDSYDNIRAAIDALHSPPDMYGFVAATKVDENFMSQQGCHRSRSRQTRVGSSSVARNRSRCSPGSNPRGRHCSRLLRSRSALGFLTQFQVAHADRHAGSRSRPLPTRSVAGQTPVFEVGKILRFPRVFTLYL